MIRGFLFFWIAGIMAKRKWCLHLKHEQKWANAWKCMSKVWKASQSLEGLKSVSKMLCGNYCSCAVFGNAVIKFWLIQARANHEAVTPALWHNSLLPQQRVWGLLDSKECCHSDSLHLCHLHVWIVFTYRDDDKNGGEIGMLRCVKKSRFRIFSFLDITSLCRCAETCRQWNMLALDGSNWQQVDLFRFQKDIKVTYRTL